MPDSWIGLSRRRLRLFLSLFFLALAIPTAILVRQAYQQLKWESFYQHRVLAEELAARIDSRLRQLISVEEARPGSDYAFLVLAGDPSANFVVRSPLSGYPVRSAIPGLIGYFQLDDQGTFSTPLLPPAAADPAAYGIPSAELKERVALRTRLQELLSHDPLLTAPGARAGLPFGPTFSVDPSPSIDAIEIGVGFGSLNDRFGTPAYPEPSDYDGDEPLIPQAGRASRQPHDAPAADAARQRGALTRLDAPPAAPPNDAPLSDPRPSYGPHRTTRSILLELQARRIGTTAPQPRQAPLRAMMAENEIDPFEFRQIGSGQFLLSRRVWHEGRRMTQGALIEPEKFLRALVERDFRRTAVSRMSELEVALGGRALLRLRGTEQHQSLSHAEAWGGDLLYRTRLSPPLSDMELIFTIAQLPTGPGVVVVSWLGGILAVVLCGGCWLLYRLGLRQIAVSQQQQDFVSAVSHELKTPLTSIRMYGEMLREGWVSEDRKASYYDFICNESERLSRLITNILQLARMTRGGLGIELRTLTAAQLLGGVQPAIASQIEHAGFILRVTRDHEAAATVIKADEDCFAQIAINLVDNAIKFCSRSPNKRIDLSCYRQGPQSLVISVRDFGPGVPKDRMKKIFRLFYRGENEQVRETVGTGIGLALVEQLAAAMNARVDVVNRDPGAEFRIWFGCCDAMDREPPARKV